MIEQRRENGGGLNLPAVKLSVAALLLTGVAVGHDWSAAGRQGSDQGIAQSTRSFAIVGTNVVPMDGERVLVDRTVLIEDGLIQAVARRGAVEIPDGAQRIDGAGTYLVPGFADMHVHFDENDAEDHLKLYIAHGVTTVQSMHGSPWHLELRRRVAARELTGPRIFTTGPTTARIGMTTPAEAEAIVREQKDAGYDAIKQYGSGRGPIDRETYAALLAAARREGMRVVGHAPRNLPFRVVLEEGQSSIDHMEEIVYTSEAIAEVFGPYIEVQFGRATVEDHPEVMRGLPDNDRLTPVLGELAAQVKAAGLYVTPTLIAFDRIQATTTDEIYRLAESAEMAYVRPYTRVQWSPAFNRYRNGGWNDKLELMAGVLERSHELQMRMVGAFHAAGVPIMAGTDAPLVYVFPGSSLHREMALLVKSGLTPYQALEAATTTPARFLDVAEESGTIAPGMRADLVLLEANPLADISNTRRIGGVVANGEWFSRARIDQMLAEIAERHAKLAERVAAIADDLAAGRVSAGLRRYRAVSDPDPDLASFVEGSVNRLGYRRLRSGDVEGALEIFRLNTEYFPNAFNTWDSLAEAHMIRGEDELAIEYYEKSLQLNPDNENARTMIRRIRERDGS